MDGDTQTANVIPKYPATMVWRGIKIDVLYNLTNTGFVLEFDMIYFFLKILTSLFQLEKWFPEITTTGSIIFSNTGLLLGSNMIFAYMRSDH